MSQRGFTLIELLVVIAIIALLSSVVLASLTTARVRAMDARRVADAQSVIKALALYRIANPLGYPATDGNQYGCNTQTCFANLTNELVPTYLPFIPMDPVEGNTANGYRYCRVNAEEYRIIVPKKETNTFCTVRTQDTVTGSTCWTTNGTLQYPYCN